MNGRSTYAAACACSAPSLRRLWVSERRHLPAQDVALAGGWRSIQTMRDSYQQASPDTVLDTVENAGRNVLSVVDEPTSSPARSEIKARQ